ncbi:Hypothetical predicted protein [Octopus vulgaris]|uniref:Uncharacterized protein n=1 Tax=Octopus vulgaris TaxID=6645 RepID=A0AA36APC3_OCTVU|nr:Hypothetical predicted protein [Octopus vulgaris]
MELKGEEFNEFSSVEQLRIFKQSELLLLAKHYYLDEVKSVIKKKEIFKVVLEHLVDEEIFEDLVLSLLKSEKTEEFELRKLELEFQKAIKEMEIQKELKLKEIELQSRKLDTPRDQKDFDVAKNIRLVPPFSEKDVVQTPGRRKQNRLCHMNMIKKYYDRSKSVPPSHCYCLCY